MESLKTKTIKGVSWSAIDNIASAGITFLVGLVLARLLSPSEFGILGMITIFIAISNSIIDSGFSNALIRKTNARRIDYNTVFLFNLFLSLVLYAVLFLCSPFISKFFNEPKLIAITRILGITLIINAISIIQRTLLVKKIDFKTQTKISLISSIGSGVVGIGMAYSGFGVWSLVGQQLSRQTLNSLFLWIFSKWRPVFEFSTQSFKELFGFGSKLLLSGLIDTIYNNIYYLIIGRFYSSFQLGQYTRAEQFKNVFTSNLTGVIQRVSYPVLSSIQEEPERLKQAYRKVIKTTVLISFFCMLSLAAVAKPLILLLIGEKWLESVYYLQIICFAGMLYPLHAINLNILQVKGRSDLFLKLEIIKKCIGIIPILLGIFYGIEYMLWGSVFISFLSYFLNSYYSSGLINYPTGEQIKDILPISAVSILVSFSMWNITLLHWPNWITLLLQCCLGITLLTFIYELMKLPEYLELKSIVTSGINKIQVKNGSR